MLMVSGEKFITREEFNKRAESPGAPKDYTYNEYVDDSCIPDKEWIKARMEFLKLRII